jgi:hypothetical protein
LEAAISKEYHSRLLQWSKITFKTGEYRILLKTAVKALLVLFKLMALLPAVLRTKTFACFFCPTIEATRIDLRGWAGIAASSTY